MPQQRKVILYIAMSLDGYIATPDGNLDFLSIVEQKGQDYGYSDFIKTISTVILGRKAYDKVLSFGIPFPHADKQTFVITRTSRPNEGNIVFYKGNLNDLVQNLKKENVHEAEIPGPISLHDKTKNIFIDGGAEIVNELMKENLIDEFIISVIPVFLGDGISLFKSGRPENKLKLISSVSFEKGLVQLHYKIVRE